MGIHLDSTDMGRDELVENVDERVSERVSDMGEQTPNLRGTDGQICSSPSTIFRREASAQSRR